MHKIKSVCLCLVACLITHSSSADILRAEPDNFELKFHAETTASPQEVWATLIEPADWWSSAHTYSGDAANLSLSPIAGGHWQEKWAQGSVWHGTVLHAQPSKSLRLQAPFGPLQGLTLNVIWTVTLTPHVDGTQISFDIVAQSHSASQLDQLAGPVDGVFAEAIESLIQATADEDDG